MASFNFNKVILGGRIARDPELKTTQSGLSVTQFSIAVNRKSTKDQQTPQADFINVTAWRNTAEFITKFFRKGNSICIVGSIQTRSFTDKTGSKREVTEVVADEAYFVDSKQEVSQTPQWNAPQNAQNDAQQYYVQQAATYATTVQMPSQGDVVHSDAHSKLEELNQEPAFSTDEELPF